MVYRARRAIHEEESVEVVRIIQGNKGYESDADRIHFKGAFEDIGGR